MDISWKQALTGMFAMAMVVAVIRPSAFDETAVPVKPVPTAMPKIVVQTKTIEKIVERRIPGKRPDGYISREECYAVQEGMPVQDMMWRWGWPAGENGARSYTGNFYYPVRGNHRATCSIDIMYGKVNVAEYRETDY